MTARERARDHVAGGFPLGAGLAAALLEELDEMESRMLAARTSERAREKSMIVLRIDLENARQRVRRLEKELAAAVV